MSDEATSESVPMDSSVPEVTNSADSSPSTTGAVPKRTTTPENPGVNSATSSEGSLATKKKEPLCILVLGMAGSGKTSVVQRLCTNLAIKRKPFQAINLDPAVKHVPFVPYIDIRDTVNYKEVMKQYGLGPNGGIVTSLNLFSTMFDDVLNLIAKKEDQLDYIVFDTPGQIEVFNWSASGPIIAGALASVYPTMIVYVIDTVRSNRTQTFMANMLYACSILYKYKLPFMIVFNKIDITDWKFASDWMQDFETFQDVVAEETTYVSNLTRSLSLVLEEFYCNIDTCGVSAFTGEGMDKFVSLLDKGAVDYEEYRAEYEKLKAEKLKQKELEKSKIRANVQADLPGDASAASLKKVRKTIKDETEVLISLGQSDSETDDEELDVDDIEETNEQDAFKSFLSEQKKKHEQQRQQQLFQQHQK